MGIWSEIETISSNLQLLASKGGSFKATPPLEVMGAIRKRLVSGESTYADFTHIKGLSDKLDLPFHLSMHDYLHGGSMSNTLSLICKVDAVIGKLNIIKDKEHSQ